MSRQLYLDLKLRQEVGSVSLYAARALSDTWLHLTVATLIFFSGRASTPKALDDNAHGLVLLRCGGESMLNDHASNIFLYDSEPLYVDEGTHKPLNYTQKPVAFLSRLIQLFTSPGDWVLDGLSGTGKMKVVETSFSYFTLCS